mgnify:CR=1 FL=1
MLSQICERFSTFACDILLPEAEQTRKDLHAHPQEIASCTPNLSDELLDIWERSVRAVHHFLAEFDIVRIRAYVPKAIQTVEHLAAAEDSDGKTLALIGAREGRPEMLFVDSSCRGGV